MNALLLLLTGVWLRNFRLFGTEPVAGLAAFALVILAENVVALYFFFTVQSFYAGDPRTSRRPYSSSGACSSSASPC